MCISHSLRMRRPSGPREPTTLRLPSTTTRILRCRIIKIRSRQMSQITRGNTMGIYNADLEEAFNLENGGIGVDNVSPAGTEWAFSGLNGNPVFSYGQGAAEYQNLTFSDWETASGGTHSFPVNLVENAAVVHLVSDDIYLDLQFLSLGFGMSGDNSFSYIRARRRCPSRRQCRSSRRRRWSFWYDVVRSKQMRQAT